MADVSMERVHPSGTASRVVRMSLAGNSVAEGKPIYVAERGGESGA